jgi:hypothetical protein
MNKTHADFLEELLDFVVYEKSFRYVESGKQRESETVVKVMDILEKVKQFKALKNMTTMKTADEFLEELEDFSRKMAIANQLESGYAQGIGDAYKLVLEKIKQFQAEQKQVGDEQK